MPSMPTQYFALTQSPCEHSETWKNSFAYGDSLYTLCSIFQYVYTHKYQHALYLPYKLREREEERERKFHISIYSYSRLNAHQTHTHASGFMGFEFAFPRARVKRIITISSTMLIFLNRYCMNWIWAKRCLWFCKIIIAFFFRYDFNSSLWHAFPVITKKNARIRTHLYVCIFLRNEPSKCRPNGRLM